MAYVKRGRSVTQSGTNVDIGQSKDYKSGIDWHFSKRRFPQVLSAPVPFQVPFAWYGQVAKSNPILVAALAAAILLPGCAGVGPARAAKTQGRIDHLHAKISGSRISLPAEHGLVEIAPHVFVDSEVSPANAAHLLNLIDKARVRAGFYYGELVSVPDILFCSSMECYRKFGGIGLGYTRGNNILISPSGWRTAIISHELSHVELATRLGGAQEVVDRVPQWFDEGVAVMVSMAHEFSDAAWEEACRKGEGSPRLRELESMAGWNRVTGANGVNMQLSYGTARQEVARWYAAVGRKGLDDLISALKARQDFHMAYQSVEDSAAVRLAARN